MTSGCEHGWRVPEAEMICLDDAEIVLRDRAQGHETLRFAERHAAADPQDGRLFFLVEATAPGLTARVEGVTNYVDRTGLAQFLDDLDFRGWEGEKRWQSADRDLAVSARYVSRGQLELVWTLSPWRKSNTGEWSVTITTRLEAGAEKDNFAAELSQFLTTEGFPIHFP